MVASSPNTTKMEELILYVADRCETDPAFGAVKLHKTLFFCDFLAFERLGRAITSHTYFKKPNGPMLKMLLPICERLEQRGDLVSKRASFHGYNQTKYIARRHARLDSFRPEEIALIDEVLEMLRPMNAKDLTELTHRHPGWALATMGEDIDYAAQLLPHPDEDPPELSKDEIDFIDEARAS